MEYTLLSTHQRSIQSRIPFTIPSDIDVDKVLQPHIAAMMNNLSVDILIPNHTSDDPPWKQDVVEGEALDTTFASYDPPMKNGDAAKDVLFSTPISDDPKQDDEDFHSEEIIF